MLLDLEPSGDFPMSLITEGHLTKYWSGMLNEGDLLYMPRGVIHFGKTFPQPQAKVQHSLHVTLSNQQHNSWADLVRVNFDQTFARLTQKDAVLRQALPINIFSEAGQTKEQLSAMVDRVAEAMKKDKQMQQAIWKWQSRFMFRRQAPQEIINHDEEEDFAEEHEEQVNGVPVLTQKVNLDVKKSNGKELSSGSDDDSDSPKMTEELQ